MSDPMLARASDPPPSSKNTATTENPAALISQELLDVTGRAFMSRNFELLIPKFLFPHRIITFEKSTVIESREDMERTFFSLCNFYEANGVTDLIRTCVSACFTSRDQVEATHVTHIMAGDSLLKPAFPTFSVIQWHEGIWKIASGQYAVAGARGYSGALTAGSAAPANPSKGETDL